MSRMNATMLSRAIAFAGFTLAGVGVSGCSDREGPVAPERLSVLRPAIANLIGGGTWSIKAPMPTARQGAVAGVIGGKLYVAGGCCISAFDPQPFFATLEVYDPATNTWSTMAPMPLAVTAAAGGVINGKLYVAGGAAAGGEVATLQVYDAATNTWTTKAPMPVANSSTVGGVIDGRLYVVGGTLNDNDEALRVYDPIADNWTEKASMPDGMAASVGAGVIDGKLYVVGGSGLPCPLYCAVVGTLRVYDPVADAWGTREPMPTPRVVHSVAVLSGQLHVVGGALLSCCDNITGAHEVYDPSSDTWTTEAALPTARHSLVTDVIDGRLYATGGAVGLALPENFRNALDVFAQPYSTVAGHAFLAPITLPPAAPRVFKIGSTIPVKFHLFLADGGTPATSAVATIAVTMVAAGVPDGVPVTVVSTVASAGTAFRYDADAHQYVFNLGTKNWVVGTYQITASLDDGSQIVATVGAR